MFAVMSAGKGRLARIGILNKITVYPDQTIVDLCR